MQRGKEVMEYMCGVASNLYRNCFINFKDQNSHLLGQVIDVVHNRYSNPLHATFQDVWVRTRIREILSNKRSHLKKPMHDDQVNQATGCYPTEKPTTTHKREWKEEKKEEIIMVLLFKTMVCASHYRKRNGMIQSIAATSSNLDNIMIFCQTNSF